MSLRMNPTPLGAIDYESHSTSSSSIMTSDVDVAAALAHDEATTSDLHPAVKAEREDDVGIAAEVREEPQCEITVVESDLQHNAAHGVQQQQSADLQLQQEQAAPPPPPQDRLSAPITPQPPAAATDVHFVAGDGIQVAAGAGRVPWQRRIQNQVRRLGASGNEPALEASVRRSGTRQIRRPQKFLDCVVPYFCSREPR